MTKLEKLEILQEKCRAIKESKKIMYALYDTLKGLYPFYKKAELYRVIAWNTGYSVQQIKKIILDRLTLTRNKGLK